MSLWDPLIFEYDMLYGGSLSIWMFWIPYIRVSKKAKMNQNKIYANYHATNHLVVSWQTDLALVPFAFKPASNKKIKCFPLEICIPAFCLVQILIFYVLFTKYIKKWIKINVYMNENKDPRGECRKSCYFHGPVGTKTKSSFPVVNLCQNRFLYRCMENTETPKISLCFLTT